MYKVMYKNCGLKDYDLNSPAMALIHRNTFFFNTLIFSLLLWEGGKKRITTHKYVFAYLLGVRQTIFSHTLKILL